jgi:hypothetical protein
MGSIESPLTLVVVFPKTADTRRQRCRNITKKLLNFLIDILLGRDLPPHPRTPRLRPALREIIDQAANAGLASRGTPPSHAREGDACPHTVGLPHTEPMAGSPLKRMRNAGIRLEDGSVIAFPYMPRVADLPPGWRHFTTAQKIDHLIGFVSDAGVARLLVDRS